MSIKNKPTESFCVMPFIGAQYSAACYPNDADIKPCCFYKGEAELKKFSNPNKESKIFIDLQTKFLEGKFPSGCNACWNDEKLGKISLRETMNERYTNVIKTGHYLQRDLMFLEHKPSNVCNLACRMCDQHSSSKWYQINKELESNREISDIIREPKKFNYTKWEEINLKGLVKLKLMGGEPLYQKETYELVKYLDNLKLLRKIEIDLITNCTVSLSPEFKKLIQKSKTTIINLSIDAFGVLNDYIRVGSNWKEVFSILNEYINFRNNNKNIILRINSTITVYNFNCFLELKNFCDRNNIIFNSIVTSRPSYQDVRILEDSKKIKLSKDFPSNIIAQIMQTPYNEDERIMLRDQLKRATSFFDNYHRMYLKDYNLEMYDAIFDN